MKENEKKKRGQAAIFDGIMFLLLVSLSVAMMFAFLSDYGNNQMKILRSSHLLNYVQGIGKTIYSLDASMLAETDLQGGGRTVALNCNELEKFRSNSVADLLKRDVSDRKLNNKFGESDSGNAPGKLALRCALFELMKPVVGSGFDYHAEILDGDASPRFTPFPLLAGDDPEPLLVTNLDASDSIYREALVNGCDSISRALQAKQLLAISTPFRVFDENGVSHDHQLRICMWPSERRNT